MAAPHPVGARIVMLDARLARVAVKAHEWGEPLPLRAPPSGSAPVDGRAALANPAFAAVARRFWAPAHLRAWRQDGGEVRLSWVRCARIGGDSWGAGEPPIGAPGELYRVEVSDGSASRRVALVSSPVWVYSADDQVADFGGLVGSLSVRVAQIDADGRPGLNAELTITL